MTRIVYINGAFVPENEATVPIFDRGLLFADAVYEGLGVLDGQIIDFLRHMRRLRRSLGELAIPEPFGQDDFFAILMELIRRNAIAEGFLYLHVTRGVADRDYLYPEGLKPTVFAFTQVSHGAADGEPQGMRLQSTPDLRWQRRDIKTSNLLGQVLAKRAADAAGADEALMVGPDGYITEGGATSFFIVKDRSIIARPVTNEILHGVTRQSMLAVAKAEDLRIQERRITLEEAYDADEAFITGASSYVEPVASIDGRTIGDGVPGEITRKLRSHYLKAVRASFYRPAGGPAPLQLKTST
ncbi:MAG: D-amino-acid transaminase [Pseudomonadota bacterium]